MLGLSPVRVCEACVAEVRSLHPAPDTVCMRCGDALGMESARYAAAFGVHECTTCRVNPPLFARAVAFGPYDGAIREMLHALKFEGVTRVAEHVLGPWMAEAVLQLEGQTAEALVVLPVPLFKGRQRERGYNQAELLARSAVRRLRTLRPGWKLALRTDVLLRVKDTKAMFELRPDQRRRNLVGAFRVAQEDAVRGREVLLVDDILTTGATATQCTKVLLQAGASRVWIATVSRAQPESMLAVVQKVARWDMAGEADGLRPRGGLEDRAELA